jgi:hypothetical protein
MVVTTLSHDGIAHRAYEIYLRSGMREGRCTHNWYQAEYDLRRQGIRAALMSEPAMVKSADDRNSEILSGKNPRADAKLICAVSQAKPAKKVRRDRPKSAMTPHVEISSSRGASLNRGSLS